MEKRSLYDKVLEDEKIFEAGILMKKRREEEARRLKNEKLFQLGAKILLIAFLVAIAGWFLSTMVQQQHLEEKNKIVDPQPELQYATASNGYLFPNVWYKYYSPKVNGKSRPLYFKNSDPLVAPRKLTFCSFGNDFYGVMCPEGGEFSISFDYMEGSTSIETN